MLTFLPVRGVTVKLELLFGVLGAPISLEQTEGGPPSIESSALMSGGSILTIVELQLCCGKRTTFNTYSSCNSREKSRMSFKNLRLTFFIIQKERFLLIKLYLFRNIGKSFLH